MTNNEIPKFLLETDVLFEYLVFNRPSEKPSLLTLMQKGICFTSVLNATELFILTKSEYQKNKVRDLLNAIKVLGLHSRYSLLITDYRNNFNNIREALFYILAEQNKLVIVSLNPERYSGLKVESMHSRAIP
jgi:hypothetical protein